MSVKTLGGGLPLVVRAVLAMSRDQVVVGIPGDAPARQEPGAPPNALIGYVMETGDPALNIPARPFLGPGIADARPAVVAEMKRAGVEALKDAAALKTTAGAGGGAVAKGLDAVGRIARDSVRFKMVTGPFQPLKPSTIRGRQRRGNASAKPLLDTEQLHDAVTYRVRPKRGR